MDQPAFGIYIHWPFCAAKCPYCDFNSHVRQSIDHDAWRISYRDEIRHYASLTRGRTVRSIFFGGGTPSLMQPQTVEAIIAEIAGNWPVLPDCEITLEANPTSIEAEKFRAFRAAGINRVSVGVQSFRDEDLRFLGREHSSEEALRALEIARQSFDRFSFDLIYARPEQSLSAWQDELQFALAQAAGHMSLYQLTIEKGTPFFTRHKRGDFAVPDNDRAGAFYELTQEIMEDAGLPAYEISNHATTGQESIHNMIYWQYGDYAGIGPGAHGRLTLDGCKVATRGHRAPEIWMQRVAEHGHGSHPFETIDYEQRFTEALMMGLRTAQGLSLKRLGNEGNAVWTDLVDVGRLEALIGEGLLVHENDNLRPTTAGMQRLNGILEYLL